MCTSASTAEAARYQHETEGEGLGVWVCVWGGGAAWGLLVSKGARTTSAHAHAHASPSSPRRHFHVRAVHDTEGLQRGAETDDQVVHGEEAPPPHAKLLVRRGLLLGRDRRLLRHEPVVVGPPVPVARRPWGRQVGEVLAVPRRRDGRAVRGVGRDVREERLGGLRGLSDPRHRRVAQESCLVPVALRHAREVEGAVEARGDLVPELGVILARGVERAALAGRRARVDKIPGAAARVRVKVVWR